MWWLIMFQFVFRDIQLVSKSVWLGVGWRLTLNSEDSIWIVDKSFKKICSHQCWQKFIQNFESPVRRKGEEKVDASIYPLPRTGISTLSWTWISELTIPRPWESGSYPHSPSLNHERWLNYNIEFPGSPDGLSWDYSSSMSQLP
jgi:hypothetical protein